MYVKLGYFFLQTTNILLLFSVNAILKDASNCKTDEHDSEDEELPEDEIDSTFR